MNFWLSQQKLDTPQDFLNIPWYQTQKLTPWKRFFSRFSPNYWLYTRMARKHANLGEAFLLNAHLGATWQGALTVDV